MPNYQAAYKHFRQELRVMAEDCEEKVTEAAIRQTVDPVVAVVTTYNAALATKLRTMLSEAEAIAEKEATRG